MITENKTIDELLGRYRRTLKTGFTIYRNHVYRMYNYIILLDNDRNNYEKYAIASVFHDLGIWTNSFDYLEPSIQLASDYLKSIDKQSWTEEISLMIYYHHKMSSYKGKFQKTVETFRRADWIDVRKGKNLFNIEKSTYSTIQKHFTNKGFSSFLLKQSLRHFIRHPLNPLPMLKK